MFFSSLHLNPKMKPIHLNIHINKVGSISAHGILMIATVNSHTIDSHFLFSFFLSIPAYIISDSFRMLLFLFSKKNTWFYGNYLMYSHFSNGKKMHIILKKSQSLTHTNNIHTHSLLHTCTHTHSWTFFATHNNQWNGNRSCMALSAKL